MRTAVLAFVLLILAALNVEARDRAVVREFRKHNPCPLTGRTTGPCRLGDQRMVVDHMVPLCAGGPDDPANMAWQDYRESLVKDAHERRLCARVRRCPTFEGVAPAP